MTNFLSGLVINSLIFTMICIIIYDNINDSWISFRYTFNVYFQMNSANYLANAKLIISSSHLYPQYQCFQLMKDAADKIGDIVKEFKDKMDFCVSANIPVPPLDLEFFNLRQHFMVGPVPMSLGLYI